MDPPLVIDPVGPASLASLSSAFLSCLAFPPVPPVRAEATSERQKRCLLCAVFVDVLDAGGHR